MGRRTAVPSRSGTWDTPGGTAQSGVIAFRSSVHSREGPVAGSDLSRRLYPSARSAISIGKYAGRMPARPRRADDGRACVVSERSERAAGGGIWLASSHAGPSDHGKDTW